MPRIVCRRTHGLTKAKPSIIQNGVRAATHGAVLRGRGRRCWLCCLVCWCRVVTAAGKLVCKNCNATVKFRDRRCNRVFQSRTSGCTLEAPGTGICGRCRCLEPKAVCTVHDDTGTREGAHGTQLSNRVKKCKGVNCSMRRCRAVWSP
jgi:hypothetical protein